MSILVSPTVLYTGTITASALNTWKYVTVSGLSVWKEARVWIEIGDAFAGYRLCTRNNITVAASAYASTRYFGSVRVCCDFANNKVGVNVLDKLGWGFEHIKVTRIEGLVKN